MKIFLPVKNKSFIKIQIAIKLIDILRILIQRFNRNQVLIFNFWINQNQLLTDHEEIGDIVLSLYGLYYLKTCHPLQDFQVFLKRKNHSVNFRIMTLAY